MVDLEVEETLREIRERVRATTTPAPDASTSVAAPVIETDASATGETVIAADSLARLAANLTTTERTQTRLPPLLSNRQGWLARLELWIKRKLKRATHWFTWEQVNFNSATHAALRETLATLSLYEQRLTEMQAEIGALRRTQETLAQDFTSYTAQVAEQFVAVAASSTEMRNSHTELHSLYTELRNSFADTCAQMRGQFERAHEETRALRTEQQERLAHLTEEMRVSFKQLSLEASETATLSDRARRRTDARLAELVRRVESLEAEA